MIDIMLIPIIFSLMFIDGGVMCLEREPCPPDDCNIMSIDSCEPRCSFESNIECSMCDVASFDVCNPMICEIHTYYYVVCSTPTTLTDKLSENENNFHPYESCYGMFCGF